MSVTASAIVRFSWSANTLAISSRPPCDAPAAGGVLAPDLVGHAQTLPRRLLRRALAKQRPEVGAGDAVAHELPGRLQDTGH
eukprot:CAMPEP_0173269812 /NCGR_PEP_ID=MMETSP1142-20121109/31076_1 /TAXON_ID=483371 /ORGANISM="non described non described, Strain CCMP2298" /LENGTH=81 /DNA_ID=CAMNT_0014206179 /DNA_START=501 /DNA_END=746 /DNA_ORIENTATION=+